MTKRQKTQFLRLYVNLFKFRKHVGEDEAALGKSLDACRFYLHPFANRFCDELKERNPS